MPDESRLPAVVDALIGSAVRSIEELEVLLHLFKATQLHTALEIASALMLAEGPTVSALQSLVLAQLVQQVGAESPLTYRFSPGSPELRTAVEQLARAYEENRFEVVMRISTRAIERLRSRVLRRFAGSFRSGSNGDD